MKQEYEVGRAYWLRDGREVEYLALTAAGQHVVAPVIELETYDGRELGRGPAEFTSELFAKAPVEKRSEEIVALEVKVRELEKRKAELFSECVNSEREVRARLDKLKKFAGLERIEDFVEGRVTHVVIENYGDTIYDVVPLDNLQQYSDSYTRKPEGIKLISLFGSTGGDLQWRSNQWRDESGTWRMIVPCSSEEEGQARRLDLIAEGLASHWAEYRSDRAYSFLRFAKASIESGISLSAEQDAAYRAAVKQVLDSQRAALTKEITDRQARLADVENRMMSA
jgi:hypothetical protein